MSRIAWLSALCALACWWTLAPVPARPPARVVGLHQHGATRPLKPSRTRRPAASIGHVVRRLLRLPPSAELDRRAGWATLAAAIVGGLALPLAPIAGATAWAVGWWRGRQATRRVAAEVVDEMPDLVGLLTLAVGSGLNVALAVAMVAQRAPPRSGAALRAVLDDVAAGTRLADALDALPSLLGPAVRPIAAALTSAERYGSPLLPLLDQASLEVRLDRRRRSEEAIRRVPVTLLFPLVTCVLPAFALLTVAPLIAGALSALRH